MITSASYPTIKVKTMKFKSHLLLFSPQCKTYFYRLLQNQSLFLKGVDPLFFFAVCSIQLVQFVLGEVYRHYQLSLPHLALYLKYVNSYLLLEIDCNQFEFQNFSVGERKSVTRLPWEPSPNHMQSSLFPFAVNSGVGLAMNFSIAFKA